MVFISIFISNSLFFIRYGKSLVFDMLEVDMLGFLEERLNEIQENLFSDLINKQLISSKRFKNLM